MQLLLIGILRSFRKRVNSSSGTQPSISAANRKQDKMTAALFPAELSRGQATRGKSLLRLAQRLFSAATSVACTTTAASPTASSARCGSLRHVRAGEPSDARVGLAATPSRWRPILPLDNSDANPPTPPLRPWAQLLTLALPAPGGSNIVVRQRSCRQRVCQGNVAALVLRLVFLVAIQAFLSLCAQSPRPTPVCRYSYCSC